MPVVTWKHISLDGFTSVFFAMKATADEIDDVTYTPPDGFIAAFPGLVALVSPSRVSTDSTLTASYLDFSTAGIMKSTEVQTLGELGMRSGTANGWTRSLPLVAGGESDTG